MSVRFAILVLALLPFTTTAYGQTSEGFCGPVHLPGTYGPFDYRTATVHQKRLVEGAHFTPSVETLKKGHRGYLGGDIHYTLNVFPNHPRALLAMTKLSERLHTNQPIGAVFTVECYYFRAIRFAPDDAAIHALYAHFLIDRKRFPEAREQLKAAEATSIGDPQVSYNIGLAYFELKEYDRALKHAQQAYRAGVSFPTLKEKLVKAGKWRDPQ